MNETITRLLNVIFVMVLLLNQIKKVRDHCHRTGCYRGAAHNACNINYYNNRCLPVVFHNLRGYDSHLIIKKAFDVVKDGESINAIPNSGEKCVTFSIGLIVSNLWVLA